MTDQLKGALFVQYDGIQILYLEDINKWRFELRGRERKADTLKQAKEWIDKPEPVKKPSKAFERFEAYLVDKWAYSYGNVKASTVTVTSAAQDTNTATPSAAWVVNDKGERSKVSVEQLLEITADTKRKFAEHADLMKQSEAFKNKAQAVFASIKRVDLSKYIDNGDE